MSDKQTEKNTKKSFSKQNLFDSMDKYWYKEACESADGQNFTISFKAPVKNKLIDSWVKSWCQKYSATGKISGWDIQRVIMPDKDTKEEYKTTYQVDFVWVGIYKYTTPKLKVDSIIYF